MGIKERKNDVVIKEDDGAVSLSFDYFIILICFNYELVFRRLSLEIKLDFVDLSSQCF